MAGSKSIKLKKTKGNYCFPNFLGKVMAKVGQRVQFESSLLSISLILLGLMIMTIVTIFGTDLSLFIKIMAGVNGIAAFLFLSSHLITTFQQYQAYLSIMGILEIEDLKTEGLDVEDIEIKDLKIKDKDEPAQDADII
jgi:hypothetical protein